MKNTVSDVDYNLYQELMETQTLKYISKINDYEKQVAMLNSILDMYKYLNDFQLSNDLYEIIIDMIVGVLGVSSCTIAIVVNRKLLVMASSDHKIGTQLDIISLVDSCMLEYITKNNEIIGAIEVRTAKGSMMQGNTRQFLKLICAQLLLILDNRSLNEKIFIQANTDLLTGCCNRRAFYDMIKNRSIDKNGYCILMLDIDKFKIINDNYGHEAGDVVLKTIGKILCKSIREYDVVCRYGGEEFIVYLHGLCSKTLGFNKAETIRKVIERSVVIDGKTEIKYTTSIGVAVVMRSNVIHDIRDVIKIADNNLFKSKNTGRNKSTI